MPPSWVVQAACRGMDPAIFLPDDRRPLDAARAVCAGCPVREPCLAEAVADPSIRGVWAGTTFEERVALRKASPGYDRRNRRPGRLVGRRRPGPEAA